jgi:hydroxymethylpyrimidine pyrophosphatase-like HAD family hydrolase
MNRQAFHKTSIADKEKLDPQLIEHAEKLEIQANPSASAMHVTNSGWKQLNPWKLIEEDHAAREQGSEWSEMTVNLLHTLDEMGDMLAYTLSRKSWLDAYLAAAGMNQIAEDYLHPDPWYFGKLEKYIRKLHGNVGKTLLVSVRTLAKIHQWMNELKGSTRQVIRWQAQLASVVEELASVACTEALELSFDEGKLRKDGEILLDQKRTLPRQLNDEIIKLPSCFRSFDQQPEDLRRIVEEFSCQWPDRERRLYIIGIRTSGSYLAPIYRAVLKAGGYQNVNALTLRPGTQMTQAERMALHEISQSDGLALVCDDPPISGSTLAKMARELENSGLSSQHIILLLQLNGDAYTLPEALQKYPRVLKEKTDWKINKLLDVEQVKRALAGACSPNFVVLDLARIFLNQQEGWRDHARAIFRVDLLDVDTQQRITRMVQVKGVGLGYFGEHEAVLASKLPEYSPIIIALKDGLLYQDLPNPIRRLNPSIAASDDAWQERMTKYVAERNRRLQVADDRSLKVNGRNAVWEVASNMLSAVFGRGWVVARMPLVDPFVKRILQPIKPSIVDGAMSFENWLYQEEAFSPLIKLNLADRAFSHMDLACYDPSYDLAGLAVEVGCEEKACNLRSIYEKAASERISSERWMLLQLVHLWDLNRQHFLTDDSGRRRMTRVVERYFSEIYFKDLPINSIGRTCTLDIDGVLETNQLGFPSLSSSSARSLCALIQHGYVVVLASGRSFEEVKERCNAYHLAGGVAEYGSVLYSRVSGKAISLLTEAERGVMFQLRSRILSTPGISLEAGYRYCVRAYQVDKTGKHSRLSEEIISRILEDSKSTSQVYVIQGDGQTDFVASRINKGAGLMAWLERFNPDALTSENGFITDKPLEMAVGDSMADVPMLALAKRPFAPSHTRLDHTLQGIQITSKPYQQGVEQAVRELIHHRPGGCRTCTHAIETAETSYMLKILSVQEGGPIKMVVNTAKLFGRRVK